MGAMKRYRAFISYSQRDQAQARRLHRALEAYKVPKGLAAAGFDEKTRLLGRFFRDEADMQAAADIGATVRGAIADSSALIVVCSPRSAQSRWVEAEVAHFRATQRGDNIFAVIVDGEPNTSRAERECFPPALRKAVPDGEVAAMPCEPLGLDVRKQSMARVCARIAAGLLDLPFDDLWRRDRRRARKRLVAMGATTALLFALIGLSAQSALDQRQNALLAASDFLANRAEQLATQQGDSASAIALVLEGLPVRDSLFGRPTSPRAEMALRASLASNRLLAMLAHAEPVDFAIFSPDGSRVVSLTDGRRVRVWDADTGALLRTLDNQVAPGLAQFSGDGRSLAVAGNDGSTRLWDSRDWTLRCRADGHRGAVKWVSFDADSARFATASNDRTARVWDVATCVLLAELRGHEDRVNFVAFTPDGERVVTASNDETARLWSPNGQSVVFSGHVGRIISADISPDGARLATASWDGSARLWDIASQETISVLRHEGPVNDVQFSGDGRLVTASYDRTARIWDAISGRELRALRGHSARLRHAAFDRFGRVLTVSDDATARLWNGWSGDVIAVLGNHEDAVFFASFNAAAARVVTASNDGFARIWQTQLGLDPIILRDNYVPLSRAIFNQDGSAVITASRDSTARVWRAESGARNDVTVRHRRPVQNVALSPDGTRFATASEDGTAQIVWLDARQGRPIILPAQDDVLLSVEFDPSGAFLLTACWDGAAVLWDARNGRRVRRLGRGDGVVTGATFSPSGEHALVTTDGGDASIWATASGQPVISRRLPAPITDAVFAPTGHAVILATADGAALIWDYAADADVQLRGGHESRVDAVDVSPNGRWIATGSADGAVRIWTSAGVSTAILRGAGGAISDVRFNPAGNLIAAASDDQTALVWEFASGRLVHVLRGHEGAVRTVQFHPSGDRLLTSSEDGSARVWQLSVGLPQIAGPALTDYACSRLPLGFESASRAVRESAGLPLDRRGPCERRGLLALFARR